MGGETGDGAAVERGSGGGEAAAAGKRLRYRHDGFTPERQETFLTWLGRTGCLKDAARKAGISVNTVRRTRDRLPDFEAKVQAALTLAAPALEAIAYRRATEGAEETVIREGKVVAVRRKPSDTMLRLLLQGANPGKYGRTGGAPRRKGKAKRKKKGAYAPRAEVDAQILRQLAVLGARLKRERGYTDGPDGRLVPPGWRMVESERDGGAEG